MSAVGDAGGTVEGAYSVTYHAKLPTTTEVADPTLEWIQTKLKELLRSTDFRGKSRTNDNWSVVFGNYSLRSKQI